MKQSFSASALLASVLTFVPTLAHAHPGHGSSFESGLVHPLAGLDHLLAMVAIGLWAAQLGGRARWAVPAAFVLVMSLGSVVAMAGVTVPLMEPALVCSVVILGLLVTAAARLPLAASLMLAGCFAAFHGLAHGMEVPPNASGLAYTGGFAVTTAALHGLGLALALGLQRCAQTGWVRLAGAAVAIAGAMLAVG